MKRYEVTFERSAYEIMTILIDAPDEDQATDLAESYMDHGFRGKTLGAKVINVETTLTGDDESMWEHMHTGQTAK